MGINADVQGLEVGNLVELFKVDLTPLGGEIYRFHGHKHGGTITWQGQVYSAKALEAEGFELTGEGRQPSPTLELGNADGFITALVIYFNDMVGATVTRMRTLSKFLDGQPTADPNEHLPDEVWIVDRKVNEDNVSVKFELTTPFEFENVQLPRRPIVATGCPWMSIGGYRGPYCGYNGPPIADVNDALTDDGTKDMCSGTVTGCKLRFGATGQLNFGGFPAAGLIR